MKSENQIKIAWLMPSMPEGFERTGDLAYWVPLFTEFQKIFPKTIFFTPGNVSQHYKSRFNISSEGKAKWFPLFNYKNGYYRRGLTILKPRTPFKLLKLKPDIVITSGFNIWTVLSALLKKIGRWKLIILYEGSSPTVDYKDSRFRIFTRKATARFADALITNSSKGEEYLHSCLKIKKSRISRIVHELPNIKKQHKNPLPKSGKTRFLYVGQLITRKGLDYLIDAWSELEKNTEKTELFIVGDGQQKNELKQKILSLRMKNVHFTGYIKNQNLTLWYQSADVFVFPTLEDTWGVPILEAMAFGKPILCSKYAGSSEIVEDQKNGFIFEPRDTGKLAELMLKFIQNPSLAKNFGKHSAKIMKIHTPSEAAIKFKKVINTLDRI